MPDCLSTEAEGNIPNHKRNLLGYSLGQTSQKETDEMPHICDYIKHIKVVVSLHYSKDIYLLSKVKVNAQKIGDPSKGENHTEINLYTNR